MPNAPQVGKLLLNREEDGRRYKFTYTAQDGSNLMGQVVLSPVGSPKPGIVTRDQEREKVLAKIKAMAASLSAAIIELK